MGDKTPRKPHGFDHTACEYPELPEDAKREPLQDTELRSYDIGLLREGQAMRLGSAAELKALPCRALEEMIVRAIATSTGSNSRKDAVSLAEDNYLRTFDVLPSPIGHY